MGNYSLLFYLQYYYALKDYHAVITPIGIIKFFKLQLFSKGELSVFQGELSL